MPPTCPCLHLYCGGPRRSTLWGVSSACARAKSFPTQHMGTTRCSWCKGCASILRTLLRLGDLIRMPPGTPTISRLWPSPTSLILVCQNGFVMGGGRVKPATRELRRARTGHFRNGRMATRNLDAAWCWKGQSYAGAAEFLVELNVVEPQLYCRPTLVGLQVILGPAGCRTVGEDHAVERACERDPQWAVPHVRVGVPRSVCGSVGYPMDTPSLPSW